MGAASQTNISLLSIVLKYVPRRGVCRAAVGCSVTESRVAALHASVNAASEGRPCKFVLF